MRRRENVSVPAVERNTNAEKGMRAGKGNGRCLPQKPLSATYWIRRASLASTPPYPAYAKGEKEREREKATRATRCKTLPVNFIALGTSSCATRYLPILGQEPPPPPRLLIRSGVNLTAGTFRRTRTHRHAQRTYIVVIACVHTGPHVYLPPTAGRRVRSYKCHRKITF